MYKINKLQGYIGEHREYSFRKKDPSSSDGRVSLQCRRPGFDPWVRKIPWRRMTTHTSILAWRMPWEEEPSGLQSMGSQRVGHNWLTLTHHYLPTPPPHPGGCRLRESHSLSSGTLILGKPAATVWEGPRRRPMWVNLGLDLLRLPHAQEEAWNEALLQCSTDRIAGPADTLTAASADTLNAASPETPS